MKLDILAFGAHPDDVELGAGGTLILHLDKGYKCGIIDLTKGELGTRGDIKTRQEEAKEATAILGIQMRENLGLDDGFFVNDRHNQMEVVKCIRKYQPEIVIGTAIQDRHPDHARAAQLISNAVFLSGLVKVETSIDNKKQERWKVKALYHFIQDRYIKPDFTIDVTEVWEKKMKAIRSFKTQFFNPDSKELETPISGVDFLRFVESRAMEMGRPMGVKVAEGFTVGRTLGVKNLFDLI